ncbi:MAG: isoprenylcysteine carboxylmethyltransferase family protein [Candidatus Bathyarchaeota archaeon]|nr:MAG: isoprenylcysteine carboxylmethyltransferase family protein [Candidatus Bathyarchaeota archaeon]
MSLVSAFNIGFLNGWLLVLPLIGSLILQARVAGVREKGEKSSLDYLSTTERNVLFLMQTIISLSYVYSIFLPLRLDTTFFYIGFFVYLVGLSFSSQGILRFANSSQDSLVVGGLYRFSRHPMYVGWLFVYVGIGIACMSWLYLLLTTFLMILVHILVKAEESWCLEKYGDDYREYMEKTPKWLVR